MSWYEDKLDNDAEEMAKLGITDYDEYIEYIEDAKACAEIAHYEALEER